MSAGETPRSELRRTAVAIAAALGEQWRAEAVPWSRDILLRSTGGEDIHLVHVGHQNERIALSGRRGVWEDDEHLSPFWPPGHRNEITVSAEKSPGQIARDITRRLLPDYRGALAAARDAKRHHDEQKAAKSQLVAQLAGLLRGRVASDYSHHDVVLRSDTNNVAVSGGIRVPAGGCDIEVSLRVRRDLAIAFATRIATLRAASSGYDLTDDDQELDACGEPAADDDPQGLVVNPDPPTTATGSPARTLDHQIIEGFRRHFAARENLHRLLWRRVSLTVVLAYPAAVAVDLEAHTARGARDLRIVQVLGPDGRDLTEEPRRGALAGYDLLELARLGHPAGITPLERPR